MYHLKVEEQTRGVTVDLFEYLEVVPHDRLRRPRSLKESTNAVRRLPSAIPKNMTRDAAHSMATRDTLVALPTSATDPPETTSTTSQSPAHTTVGLPRPMFREPGHPTLLDSLEIYEPDTRRAVLREHFKYSAASYDTARVLRMIQISNTFRGFNDRPVSLEESMRRDLRRYGVPHNPNRPQPPSPQIPLEGLVARLLNLIF
jgi:hypothetical protein